MSVALLASDDDDSEHLITVCMNHMLRIWDLKAGKLTAEKDMLGEQLDEQQGQARHLMGPAQKQLLQVVDMPSRQEYFVATYSPKHHQFKFWAVEDADGGSRGIREMRPDVDFTPPIDDLMDTSVWNLEEFYIRPSRGSRQTELWIRVRSGPASQVFTVQFDPFDFGHKHHETDQKKLIKAWKEDWVAVSAGRQTAEYLDALVPGAPSEESSSIQLTNAADSWLNFLLYPARFTVPTLEAALHAYNQDRGRTVSAASLITPLEDRICTAIESTSGPHQRAHPAHQNISDRWLAYWKYVRELHKQRGDSISFVMDPYDQLPWIVSSDSVSCIRTCSDLELIELNRPIALEIATIEQSLSDEIGSLLRLARDFRSHLSDTFQVDFKRAVRVELLEEPLMSVRDRMAAIIDSWGLREEIDDDDVEIFEQSVDKHGGYTMFTTECFSHILNSMQQVADQGRTPKEQITRYGVKSLLRSAQETIIMNTEVLMDLLVLLLFLVDEFEVDDLENIVTAKPADTDAMEVDENEEERSFNAGAIYTNLLNALREHLLLDFLTTNVRQEGQKRRRRSSSIGGDNDGMRMSSSKSTVEQVYTCTLLESIFIGDWAALKCDEEMPVPNLLTYQCRAWLSGLNVASYENFTAHVLADLIKQGDNSLATEFIHYVPPTGWSAYLQGRMHLATGNYNDASVWFKKATYAMGKLSQSHCRLYANKTKAFSYFDVNQSDTAELLRPDERDSFSDGVALYYGHVVELFGHAKDPSRIVDFCQLALQALSQQHDTIDDDVSGSILKMDCAG
jgi:hypothetical protein